jgi:aminoglycoside N3'-acetyltransferase
LVNVPCVWYATKVHAVVVTVQQLCADLRRLGVGSADVVMVHASMRAIGEVEGRAQGVVSALDQAVGPDGTVLMNLGARDDSAWVSDHPENERAALLADSEPFDYLQTPADPDNGVLARSIPSDARHQRERPS